MGLHENLVINNRFLVYIGLNRLSFAKVSGLDGSASKEAYAEGGDNYSAHTMITPREQLQTIRMERGLQLKNSQLDRLYPGMWIPTLEIIVGDQRGIPVYDYFVTSAYVTKWDAGGLDATTGNVMIEVFEMEHSGLSKMRI